MKKTFYVTIPITSTITVVVDDVEDEAEAERIAFEKADRGRLSFEMPEGEEEVEVGELGIHKRICQGNVFHGVSNEMEIHEE